MTEPSGEQVREQAEAPTVAPSPPPPAPAPAPAPTGEPIGGSERWKEKATRLRLLFYMLGTHVLAGFIWLLFYIGSHAGK